MGDMDADPVQLAQESVDSCRLQRRQRDDLLARNCQSLPGALQFVVLSGAAGDDDVDPAFLFAVVVDRLDAGNTVFAAYLVQAIQQQDQAS